MVSKTILLPLPQTHTKHTLWFPSKEWSWRSALGNVPWKTGSGSANRVGFYSCTTPDAAVGSEVDPSEFPVNRQEGRPATSSPTKRRRETRLCHNNFAFNEFPPLLSWALCRSCILCHRHWKSDWWTYLPICRRILGWWVVVGKPRAPHTVGRKTVAQAAFGCMHVWVLSARHFSSRRDNTNRHAATKGELHISRSGGVKSAFPSWMDYCDDW